MYCPLSLWQGLVVHVLSLAVLLFAGQLVRVLSLAVVILKGTGSGHVFIGSGCGSWSKWFARCCKQWLVWLVPVVHVLSLEVVNVNGVCGARAVVGGCSCGWCR